MFIGDKEIGEGWESMTCPFADGFMLIWEVGQEIDPTVPFMEHMRVVHGIFMPDLSRWRFK